MDAWQLIEDGDRVGHAIGGWGNSSGVEHGVVWQAVERLWPFAGPTELTGQGVVHVELCGLCTAAIVIQVVLAAQFALLTQGRLAGRALFFKVTRLCESKGSRAMYTFMRRVKMNIRMYTEKNMITTMSLNTKVPTCY